MDQRMARGAVVIAFAALAAPAKADPIIMTCPTEPTFRDTTVGRVAKGWTVRPLESQRPLRFITLFDGHPSERASLKPDGEPEAPSNLAKWLFPSGTKNIWLACHYRDTGAVLIKPLPNDLKQCTATYRRTHRDIEATGILACE
jgi:hypothetical protein